MLVECDTGAERCGVQSPEEALALARTVDAPAGLRFAGLMTYPAKGGAERPRPGWPRPRRCWPQPGSSRRSSAPAARRTSTAPTRSAPRPSTAPGTYIYSDRFQARRGVGTLDDCALRVLTTVVSRPNEDRLVLDAGSKTLSSDTLGLEGYGHVVEYPQLAIAKLSEEHGHVAPAGRNAGRGSASGSP